MVLRDIFENLRNFRDKSVLAGRSRNIVMGCIVMGCACVMALCISGQAQAAAPAGCQALQAKYPAYKGKQLVNAINPHTPGYEAIDPKDPNKYVGFDIDLGEKIGECLGFTLTYKAVTFAALLTTLSSGQADIVISDIYATEERAKAADFITYSKVFDGVLVAKGKPDKLEKALAVTIPYSVGIAVPKDKPEFRDAVMAALIEVQKAGIHKELLKKWELDPNNFKEPDILSVK